MTLEHHPLIKEFPEHRDRIHTLKTNDPRFHQLMDEYEALDKEILRIEQEIEPTSDSHTEELKMKRVHLKDALYRMIETAAGD
ncbi:MAG: DUF465 domain-containing protein [Gammaproteobacteria bacterium]